MIKILMALVGFEYFLASGLVNYGLKKTKLVIPEDLKIAIVDRVHRLRLDVKLLSQVLWFAILLVGFPLQFKVWGLQIALFLERFLNPVFNSLAYCQGMFHGFLLGIGVAIALWIAINWFENQKSKFYIYYLLYRCRAR